MIQFGLAFSIALWIRAFVLGCVSLADPLLLAEQCYMLGQTHRLLVNDVQEDGHHSAHNVHRYYGEDYSSLLHSGCQIPQNLPNRDVRLQTVASAVFMVYRYERSYVKWKPVRRTGGQWRPERWRCSRRWVPDRWCGPVQGAIKSICTCKPRQRSPAHKAPQTPH